MQNVYNLQLNEEKLRDLYLWGLVTGELQGPPTGKLSQDKPWLKYYTKEQIKKYYVPDMPIWEYMLSGNQKYLDDIALYYYGSTMTYRQLDDKINQFAASVLASGIKPQDVVTICMPNTPEAVIAFYALNKIGVVANMIHPLSSEKEIKNFLNEANSKMLLTIDSSLDKISKILSETKVAKTVVVSPADSMPLPLKIGYQLKAGIKKLPKNTNIESFKHFMKKGKGKKVKPYVHHRDDPAVQLHTGGTTGESKTVVLTNNNFNAMVEQFKYNLTNFERGDKMLTVMPVFHGFGLCSSLHLPLSFGVGCILIPKLEINSIDKIFDKYHPNHILGVPTLFKGILKNKKMANKDLSYVKNAVSGGDLVKNSLEDIINLFFAEHNAKVKLSKGYGLSEAVAGATFATADYNAYGSVGIPMIGTNLKLVKPGTEEEVSPGEIGEICIKGPTVMKEYYNDLVETKKALNDEWLHTGDLGCYWNDQLTFSTRKGNMIISSGVNVYPNIIEQVIEEHEAVSLCAVIGIPDEYKGEIPKAYIILKEDYVLDEQLREEIETLCKQNLNKYSVPKQYEYVEELPHTLLGKVSHTNLKNKELCKMRKAGNM